MRRFWWILTLGFICVVSFNAIALYHAGFKIKNIPAELPPRKDLRIVIISDLNSQYGSTEYEPEVDRAIALIPHWKPDLVLGGGDAIAGQKASLTKSEIEAMWAAFDLHVAAPLIKAKIPLSFTIGNHDGSGAIKNGTLVFPQERELARTYWQQRQDRLGLNFVERANFPFYYSFRQGELFFVVWDASTHIISPQQLAWVEQALDSTAAQTAAAKIVIGHLPLYPVAQTKNKPGEYLANASQLRSLLADKQVFMYVSGHHHVYYPGKMKDLKLFHAGALGQGARQLINSDEPPRQTVSVIDFKLDPLQIVYTTYDAATWNKITSDRLPASIPSIDGAIIKDD